MMSKQGFFSNSLNGYNKSEVIKYIEDQSAEIKKLNDQIAALQTEADEKTNKVVIENQN